MDFGKLELNDKLQELDNQINNAKQELNDANWKIHQLDRDKKDAEERQNRGQ